MKAMCVFDALHSGEKLDIKADDIPSSKKVTSPNHYWYAQGGTKVIAQSSALPGRVVMIRDDSLVGARDRT